MTWKADRLSSNAWKASQLFAQRGIKCKYRASNGMFTLFPFSGDVIHYYSSTGKWGIFVPNPATDTWWPDEHFKSKNALDFLQQAYYPNDKGRPKLAVKPKPEVKPKAASKMKKANQKILRMEVEDVLKMKAL